VFFFFFFFLPLNIETEAAERCRFFSSRLSLIPMINGGRKRERERERERWGGQFFVASIHFVCNILRDIIKVMAIVSRGGIIN